MELYKTQAGFNSGLKSFTTSAAAIDKMAHKLLCSAIALAAPANGGDRNVDRMRLILDAFPKSGRRKAAIHWLKEYAPVTITTEKDGSLKVKTRKDVGNWIYDSKCEDNPFWALTAEKEPAPWNPIQSLKSFIKNGQNALAGERAMTVPDGMSEESIARIVAATEAALNAEQGTVTA